jgi:hypothetical protein
MNTTYSLIMKRFAILIASTTRGSNPADVTETHLWSYISSLIDSLERYTYSYNIYVGVDDDDSFYHQPGIQNEFQNLIRTFSKYQIKLKFSSAPSCNGNVVQVWNRLFVEAHSAGNDYFHQCGDDIQYLDSGWIHNACSILKENNNVGVVGLLDIHAPKGLFTQSIVHKKHFEIFKFYFHPDLRNWFCDNFITDLYASINRAFHLKHRIINTGGRPRYQIDYCPDRCKKLVNMSLTQLHSYLDLNLH